MGTRELFNAPGVAALAFLATLVPFWIAIRRMDRRTLRRLKMQQQLREMEQVIREEAMPEAQREWLRQYRAQQAAIRQEARHGLGLPDEELQALFRDAHAHDVEQGGRDDARSAAINVWSHHWTHPATHEESETIGTFYVHWDPPVLDVIETDEGFGLEDLMQELGRLELNALGRVKHGDVPHGEHTDDHPDL